MTQPQNGYAIKITPDDNRWSWSVTRAANQAAGAAPTRPAADRCAQMTIGLIAVFERIAERRI